MDVKILVFQMVYVKYATNSEENHCAKCTKMIKGLPFMDAYDYEKI